MRKILKNMLRIQLCIDKYIEMHYAQKFGDILNSRDWDDPPVKYIDLRIYIVKYIEWYVKKYIEMH